jgi:hypothetical protein
MRERVDNKGLSASVEGIGGHGQRHLSYARVLNSVGPARLLFGAALAALRLHPGAMCGLPGDRPASALTSYAGYAHFKSHYRYFWGPGSICWPPRWAAGGMCLATTKLGEREVVAAIWWNWEIGARQALLELPNDH